MSIVLVTSLVSRMKYVLEATWKHLVFNELAKEGQDISLFIAAMEGSVYSRGNTKQLTNISKAHQ